VLRTPNLLEGALGGVTRGAVLDIAKDIGISSEETALAQHDLYNADECFLTGTGAEIIPVVSIDGRSIGYGMPGSATARIMTAFRALRVKDGVRVAYPNAGQPVGAEAPRQALG
jgi:branched-chain amino acid aminotransferase